MASNVPGISTIGAVIGYALETESGVQPTSFKQLHRINAVDEISIESETIDASALEDQIERSIAGRGSSGGTFSVTFNVTDDTIKEWEDLIEAYKTRGSGLRMWYQEYYPALSKSFFVVIEPPTSIPKPAAEQNGLLTVAMTLTIVEYIGVKTGTKPE